MGYRTVFTSAQSVLARYHLFQVVLTPRLPTKTRRRRLFGVKVVHLLLHLARYQQRTPDPSVSRSTHEVKLVWDCLKPRVPPYNYG